MLGANLRKNIETQIVFHQKQSMLTIFINIAGKDYRKNG